MWSDLQNPVLQVIPDLILPAPGLTRGDPLATSRHPVPGLTRDLPAKDFAPPLASQLGNLLAPEAQ
ncbi:hypothetical protein XM53_00780 [Roseovarius atlanticus]|uniref:Uncharacterized protein n=1 Tax=Roseovarius atlanticus TaxID=1641875 RepID=A0A0T5P019_9RHOB|nr:hypothetical protein XM53_00780 [Roseovarius atlanticus]